MRRLLLVGGGHAHVYVLERLLREPPPDCRIDFIVDTPVAVYSGMVPGFVAGQYRAAELEIDVAAAARRAGAGIVLSRAVRIDVEARRVELEGAAPVAYDVASFDIGSTVSGLDSPGVREHAVPTRPIARFVARVAEIVERARRYDRKTPFRAVVVGGGAGGVEIAFALRHRLAVETGGPVEVHLLDGGPRILASYPGPLVRRVLRRAAAKGIVTRSGARVIAVEPGAAVLPGGRRLPCETLVWVTGAASQAIFRDSNLATDDRGFVRVRSTLQFERHDNLFAAGDCAALIDYPATPKAGVYAVREGPLLTDNLYAVLRGEPLRAYVPQRDFLTLLNLGDGTALGTKWGRSFGGRWVMRLKDRIDRRFMRRFQALAAGVARPAP
jgi:selenide, water dikinase